MKITRLTATRDGKRVNIYLNGEYSFTVEKNIIADKQLYKDKVLSKEEVGELKLLDYEEKLYRKCLEKLARRPHSTREIGDYLYRLNSKAKDKLGSEQWVVIRDRVISRLIASNYLDDFQFAKYVVGYKKEKKSKVELKKLLIQKGISGDIINRVLDYEDDSEDELLKNLIEKKQKQLRHKKLTPAVEKKKVIEFLMRKGFAYDQINKYVG